MREHMQRCRELAARFGDLGHFAIASPKVILYGIVLLGLTIQFLKKPPYDRPATPDLEKPVSRNFKAPVRTPGGLYSHVINLAAADSLKYGSQWISNGQLLLQLRTGMSTHRNPSLTAHSDMDLTTLLWDYETWTGMNGSVRKVLTRSSFTFS